MSNEKDLVSTGNVIQFPQKPSTAVRAEKFSVQEIKYYDRAQFKKVVEALKAANMTFAEAVKAGVHLGLPSASAKMDAPLQSGSWEFQTGDIKEDEHKILAWQRRGEVVPVNAQLTSPVGNMENGIMVVNQSLATSGNSEVIEVFEGLELTVEEPVVLGATMNPTEPVDTSTDPSIEEEQAAGAKTLLKKAA